VVAVVAAVAVLALAGCAEGGGTAAPAAAKPADHNATDVMFLQMMLAHHEPVAKLLDLGARQASRPEVAALARELAATTAEETATITGWLESWGEPLTSDAHPDAHAAHGGLPLLDDAELAALAARTGADFDTAFLNMLIGHEHGAVELMRMETAGGRHPDAKALATRIDAALRDRIPLLLRMVAG